MRIVDRAQRNFETEAVNFGKTFGRNQLLKSAADGTKARVVALAAVFEHEV